MDALSAETKKASLPEILRVFWDAIEPQQWAMWTSIAAYIIATILPLLAPLYYKAFFDVVSSGAVRASVVPELIHFIVIVLVLNAGGWLSFRTGLYILDNLETGVMSRLRENAYNYLLGHSYGFFLNNFAGALVQRIGRLSRSFERLYDTLIFNILPLAINVVGAIVIIWLQSPFIALAMLIWVIVTMAGNYAFSLWKLKYDRRSAAADSATTGYLADAIANHPNIISFTGVPYESSGFLDVSRKQARTQRIAWDLSSILDGTQAALIVVIEFILFYYGIKLWARGAITVGTFVLIQVYLIGIAQQLWGFSRVVRTIYEGFADSEEMVSIMHAPHEVQDAPGAQPLKLEKGEITLRDVSFAFGKQQPVLSHVSLTVAPGEKVALIGPSGAGKSTLVRLILRLYNLEDGKILVDGQDIQKVGQESLREKISLVPQDPVLFHRTLMENIRYGRRDATDEEVRAAAKLAHCDDFIDGLPQGYDTYVGERGIKLSGGERQRVAIARAILKNAPILILDEATSSLDSHSEALIQDALSQLMKGRTTIVIAHRLSTIRKMDRIIVIRHGSIVEEGTHEGLLAQPQSLYKHLWDLQAGGFIKDK